MTKCKKKKTLCKKYLTLNKNGSIIALQDISVLEHLPKADIK